MKVQPKIDKFLNMLTAKRFLPQTQTQRRNLEVATKTISSKGLQGTILVDLAASARFENQGVDIAPCITATRAKTGGFLIMNQKRMTTTDELGRLQGFPTWAVDKMLSTSANAGDIRFAIGNAMSVNVLVRLLPRVLHSAGLLKAKPRDMETHVIEERQGLQEVAGRHVRRRGRQMNAQRHRPYDSMSFRYDSSIR